MIRALAVLGLGEVEITMRQVAVLIDGEVYSPQGVRISPEWESRAVAVHDTRANDQRANDHDQQMNERRDQRVIDAHPMDEIDEITMLLARATKLAQGLSDDDRRRVRELFAASLSLLHATTRLETSDQRRFEQAMRNA
jgi:hypothetical protein